MAFILSDYLFLCKFIQHLFSVSAGACILHIFSDGYAGAGAAWVYPWPYGAAPRKCNVIIFKRKRKVW